MAFPSAWNFPDNCMLPLFSKVLGTSSLVALAVGLVGACRTVMNLVPKTLSQKGKDIKTRWALKGQCYAPSMIWASKQLALRDTAQASRRSCLFDSALLNFATKMASLAQQSNFCQMFFYKYSSSNLSFVDILNSRITCQSIYAFREVATNG